MIIVLLFVSLYLVYYDFKYKKVSNKINILLFALILINKIYLEESLTIVFLSGFISFGTFFVIHYISNGGMGMGDCKYTALISMQFGYYFWLKSIFISSIIALFVTTTLYIRKKIDKKTKIPFIPFLVFGWIFQLYIN